MLKLTPLIRQLLAGSILLSSMGLAQSAVEISNAASGGYGIDLDASLKGVVLSETLTLSVGTGGPLGAYNGAGTSPYSGSTAHNAVTLVGSATASGLIAPTIASVINSILPLNVSLGVPGLTTFVGGGNFLSPSPFPGYQTVSGYGAIENLSVNVLGLLSLNLGVLESEATVAVNTTSATSLGSLTGLADANIAGLSLSVLGVSVPISLSLAPNTTLALGPLNLSLGAGLAAIDLDAYVKLVLNEQLFFIDDDTSVLTSGCAAATFSCGVATNALHLSVDVDGLVTALGLTAAGITGDIELIMGHSYAYAKAVTISAPVPEPSTYALMLGGMAVLMALSRRRKVNART